MDREDYLQLSGIQHYAFCPRQWALIYLEGQWEENVLTYGGQKLHRNVNRSEFTESRGEMIISRSVPVFSDRLRFYGIADMVEFIRDDVNGVTIVNKPGLWRPLPVEYKYGQSKRSSCDRVQLCAQAMCLEETFNIDLDEGHIFYGRPRRREVVHLSEGLRQETMQLAEEMYKCQSLGMTPPPMYGKHCERCSLVEACVPSLAKRQTVSQYLDRML
jgi:CRISPR-associated exonuclease Cas4